VLTNLVFNASKFSPPDSTIEILVARSRDVIRWSVLDRGPGVPAQQRKSVFQPYRRLEHGQGSETGGLGLGLAIVRAIVGAHGGDVGVGSRRGGGARFWFTLPMETESTSKSESTLLEMVP
jgi:signal transduction histidine kinase